MLRAMSSTAGKVVGVYVGAESGASKTAVESAELVAGYGISGDSHAGKDAHRQISLFESEVLQELKVEGIDISPESLSANLLIEGIALNALPSQSRLRIGDAIIEISEARQPCGSLTKLDRRLPKRLYQHCGVLGEIRRGGIVRAGEEVVVLSNS